MEDIGEGVYKITSKYAEPEKNYESNYISDIIAPKTIFELTLMDNSIDKKHRGIQLLPIFIKGKKERYYIDMNIH